MPSAPSRLATGTRASSRITARVGWAFQPIFRSFAPKERPGVSFSTTRVEMPDGPPSPVRTIDDVDVGDAGAGDELLHAVEHVSGRRRAPRGSSAPPRPSPRPARSGSSWRGAPSWQSRGRQRCALLVRAVAVDHPGRHVVDRHDRPRRSGSRSPAPRRSAPHRAGVSPIRRHRRARRSPPMPSAAASRITSTGKCFVSSHSMAWGARFSAANAPPCRGWRPDRR